MTPLLYAEPMSMPINQVILDYFLS
jgi:hypothetical protein